MGILDSIFGKQSDPGAAANSFWGQIPQIGQNYYNQYINTGNQAQNNARWQYEAMLDPKAFLNNLMSGYKTSEGYNFKKDLLTKEMSNTANAGGIAGTPVDQLGQTSAVQGLLSEDMQQYLSNLLGIQKTGLEGEQGIANKGFESTKNLVDLLGGSANQQGTMAYMGGLQNNANKGGFMNLLGQALGGGLNFATSPTMSIFGKTLWGGK